MSSGGWDLDANLVLMAGAGTGKTHGLITLCLHLLAGARAQGPVRPSQLCLVTFTDKAAGELRHRLRARLERLASAPSLEELEPELHGSLTRLGMPAPPPEAWRALQDQLRGALIGTFHALALQLLRRAPATTDPLPAGFELLDGQSSWELLQDVSERVVLEALEAGDAGTVELCRELDFGGPEGQRGLAPQLASVYGRMREDGLLPSDVAIGELAPLQHAFEVTLEDARSAAREAMALDAAKGGALAGELREVAAALDGMDAENFLERKRFPALVRTLRGSRKLTAQKKELGEALKRLRACALSGKEHSGLDGLFAAVRAVPLEQAFRALLGQMAVRHQNALERGGWVDFAELLVRARDLLRDHPAARRDVQGRFRALLVDEFQDTNVLQLELVTLMAEQREGAPRKVDAGGVSSLPLEPGMLCIVGDRKQSIYGFRGADVSVMARMADRILSQGGSRAFLQDNRRSSPGVLTFLNGVFARWMAPAADPRDFEVAYLAEADDLRPVRPGRWVGPCVERLAFDAKGLTAAESREQEAELLVRRVAALLSPEGPACVEEGGSLRRAQPGDVAVLFHRFTRLEVYLGALRRRGIPYRVVRGRGFYGAQEVLDLASFLALAANPEDSTALASVLRSPWVGVRDETLLWLALENGGRLGMAGLARLAAAGSPAMEDVEVLRRFATWFGPLVAERDRLGIPVLLGLALEASGYRLAVATVPGGPQALANVDKLLMLADRWQRRGRGDLARFAQHLQGLTEVDPREAEAEAAELVDRSCVQVMTIHQAKGLEWPVVCVPDLGARPQTPPTDPVLFDRRLGLALRPPLEGALEGARFPRVTMLAAEWKRREAAESLRLLYVALTRARDRLLLSGQPTASTSGTWSAKLDALCDAAPWSELVEKVTPATLPEPTFVSAPTEAPAAAVVERAEALVARVRKPAQPAAANAHRVLRVEALEDFARCPRRFAFRHRGGFVDTVGQLESAEDLDASDDGLVPRAELGVGRALVHQALARLRFGAPESQLEELPRALGLPLAAPAWGPLRAMCSRLLRSPFAQLLASAASPPLWAWDYLLPLEGGTRLQGRLDLLFEDAGGALRAVEFCVGRRPPDPGGLVPYAVVLAANARAALQLLPEGTVVTSGIVFLEDASPEFLAFDASSRGQPLEMIGTALLGAPPGLGLPGRPAEACRVLTCGFLSRCHAPSAEV